MFRRADVPSAASRIDGGTAFSAARVTMMIVGSVISDSYHAANEWCGSRQAEELDEDGETQQTEHDGGHLPQDC